MLEHEQHTAFLMALIHHQSPESCPDLEEELNQTISKEKCIRRAVFVVSLIGGLSIAGLGYAAVLLPGFFQHSSFVIVKLFNAIGLASAICLGVFLPLWAQTRAHLRRLHRQCRRAIMGSLRGRPVSLSATVRKSEAIPHDTDFLANTP